MVAYLRSSFVVSLDLHNEQVVSNLSQNPIDKRTAMKRRQQLFASLPGWHYSQRASREEFQQCLDLWNSIGAGLLLHTGWRRA